MASIRKSLLITAVQRATSAVLAIAAMMILSRLLTAEEIGLYSVAVAIIGIAQVVREFGMGSYLIQERDPTDARLRTTFTVSLLIGLSLTGLAFVAAGAVASFYNDPRLADIIRLLSVNLMLIPFGSVGLALLRRDMAFERIFVIYSIGSVANAGLSVTLAALGFGYWSLVWSSIGGNAAICLSTIVCSKDRFVYAPTLAEWRRVIGFGSRATGVAVITEIAIGLQDLLIGKTVDVPSVSIMSRAQGLVALFTREVLNGVRTVAVPAYARAHRQQEDLEALHFTSVVYITAIAWPFFGFVSLYAIDIIRLMFGPQWDAAARLVPTLSLGGAVYVPASFILSLLTATGHIGLALRGELIAQSLRVALLILCAVFAPSLANFAVAYAIGMLCFTMVAYRIKHIAIPNRGLALLRGVAKSGAVAGLTLLPPGLLLMFRTEVAAQFSSWVVLPSAALLAALSWLLALRWLNSPLYHDPYFVTVRRRAARICKF